MADFAIKKGDLLKLLEVTLKDSVGPVQINTASAVIFKMRNARTGAIKVDAAAVILDDGLVATRGQCRYLWTGTDTDTADLYYGEFEATIGGKKLTFPNGGYFTIQVTTDIS